MSIRALRVTAALSGIVGATALGVYFAAAAALVNRRDIGRAIVMAPLA